MKKFLYIFGGILGVVCIFLLLTFVLKVNNSGVGKYVPVSEGMILNTTNGNVYKVIKNNGYGTDYIWEKFISFKNEEKKLTDLEKKEIMDKVDNE